MTKRHRYIIDYLCSLNDVTISKYSSWDNRKWKNLQKGTYNDKVKYVNFWGNQSLFSLILSSIQCCAFLKENYKKNDDNIVIYTSTIQLEQVLSFIYAKFLGCKVIFDVVENYNAQGVDLSFSYKITKVISKLFYKYADGFFVISSLLKNLFEKEQNKPVCLLPNSAPVCSNKVKTCFSDPLRVVYTGTFAPKDGVKFLINGFNEFSKKENVNAELYLIGKNKIDKDSELIIKGNSSIKVLGYVSDEKLSDLLCNADVLMMTRCNSSFANYGFPFKLSEYLSTGNTVVATKVGDVPLYLKDRENAFLIVPEKSSEISEVLYYIYTHEQQAIEIGKKGKDVVYKYFDIEKNGIIFYDFIKKISRI